ncbi:uncharacterized protein LOC122855814 isoform X2 [Aphidius gifuensis]|uniref:uncharacterized protein LOC122855814 isoform X2 n=1 Tax=Aphidius gifuensis TaxID=684658 RepID=UPI001CDD3A72|nr:uncharacterized protein LOC122855814 isoform X2 [Aphidius gifuensis]
MALLSNNHGMYQSQSVDHLSSVYPTPSRSYDPVYPSPYNSPDYENNIPSNYRDERYRSEIISTPQRDMGSIEYDKTPEAYEKEPYGVLTPLTPQRFTSHGSLEPTASPQSIMYEENSMEYQTPVYCYETPPQETGYSIEGDKCQRIVEDNMNYWEPTTSTQTRQSPTSSPRRGRRKSKDVPPSPELLKRPVVEQQLGFINQHSALTKGIVFEMRGP